MEHQSSTFPEALQDLLKEGYPEVAGTSEQIIREFEVLDKESLKYAD